MNLFKHLYAVLIIISMIIPNASYAWNKKVREDFADVQGIVVGSTLYFTGTDCSVGNGDSIPIMTVPMSSVTGGNSDITGDVSVNSRYNPNNHVSGTAHFQFAASAEFFVEPGGSIGTLFAGWYRPDENSPYNYGIFYTQNQWTNYPWYAINPGQTTWPYTYIGGSSNNFTTESKRMRIDANVFFDDADGNLTWDDDMWIDYTFFPQASDCPSNWNSLARWKNSGSGAPSSFAVIGTATGGCKAAGTAYAGGEDNILEGSEIFKRGSYYYMIYSHGDWKANYRLRYCKSSTVQGLVANPSVDPALTSCTWGTVGGLFGVLKNNGHGGVFSYNGNYYIIYGHGTPADTGAPMLPAMLNIKRSAYISPLYFTANGNIMAIDTP